jgi:TetR/AcrR family transcriptional repressor of nem operon
LYLLNILSSMFANKLHIMIEPAATRELILRRSFDLIYENGYEGTSIQEIQASSNVPIGAVNYFFPTKEEIGMAMINEIIYPQLSEAMIKPLYKTIDVIEEVYDMLRTLLLQDTFFKVQFGCPAVNLIEEMAQINSNFHQSLSLITLEWQDALKDALDRWKEFGRLKKDVDTANVALFIISGYRGIRNTGKLYGKSCYDIYLQELKRYLYGLED